MILREFSFEFALLRKRKTEVIFLLALFLILLVIMTLIPLFYPLGQAAVYPPGVTKESLLESYQKTYAELMADPLKDGGMRDEELAYLAYFISTGSTEFDALMLPDCFTREAGLERLSYAFSLSEATTLLSIALALALAAYLVGYPHEKGQLRCALLAGGKRRELYLGKSFLALGALLGLNLVSLILSLIIGAPYLGEKVLILQGLQCHGVPSYLLFLSRFLGSFLGAGCLYFLTSWLCLKTHRSAFSVLGVALFLFFALLFVSRGGIRWGYHGEPTGWVFYLIYCLPITNLFFGASYGFNTPAVLVFALGMLALGLVFPWGERWSERMAL
jgi:hypothetical protein